ncbi:HIRAN domain-containing protein [Thermodesulfobacteriota bacterium]
MFEIITRLVGVTYEDAQENISKFGWPDIPNYVLVREPGNPHDHNAIRVALFAHYYMGYIPRYIARDLAPMMDSGRVFDVQFYKRNEIPNSDIVGLTVRIVEVMPSVGIRTPKTKMRSFISSSKI